MPKLPTGTLLFVVCLSKQIYVIMYRIINILTISPNNIWQEEMKNLKVSSCSSNINNQSGIYQFKNNNVLPITKLSDRFIIQDWLLTCDEWVMKIES